MAFAAGAQQVGPPQKQHPREIGRVVRIFHGKVQFALFQFVDRKGHDLLVRFGAIGHGLAHQVDGVLVKLRIGGQPSQAGGDHVVIGHVLQGLFSASGERTLSGRSVS
jgi:hypothetical protein